MNNHLLQRILSAACAVVVMSSCSKPTAEEINIIPLPQSVEATGGVYKLPAEVTISIGDESLRPAAEYLGEWLQGVARYSIQDTPGGDVTLSLGSPADEAYDLKVTKSGVEIVGGSYRGVINGIASLRQLFPAEAENILAEPQTHEGGWAIPQVTISDAPRFPWRGIHIDVARHFFDKAEMKRIIDIMALHKLNILHWHITDDEGWRVAIDAYPELTEKGGWREYNRHDIGCLALAEENDNPDYLLPEKNLREVDGKTLYGGFFTKDDIREIVAYATQRGIDVIPEVDMPGHSTIAIENYPTLSCFDHASWGDVFSAPLCPGKDATLDFCKNIYKEIFELFPYKYVHLGADEVDFTNWSKCPNCQRRMRELGLKTEKELQAWFVSEMNAFFRDNGRTLIGWDEIADVAAPQGSAVMWWRSWMPSNVRRATETGHNVVMCPNEYFYMDYPENNQTLGKLYDFDPYDNDFTPEQNALILGVQGNHWAEWIPTWNRLGHQMFPRMAAVSEIGWTQADLKNEDDFRGRLLAHYSRLDALDVHYRLPGIEGLYDTNVFTDSLDVMFSYPLPGVAIRYTTDGSVPTAESPLLGDGVHLTESTDLTLRLFRADGTPEEITRLKFVKAAYLDPVAVNSGLSGGLSVAWHDFRGGHTAGIPEAPLKGRYVTDGILIPDEVEGNIGLLFDGYIDIPADGIYTFYTDSDDGSVLLVDSVTVVDNDGGHSPAEKAGQIALRKGLHRIHARYFDSNGGGLDSGFIEYDGTRNSFEGKGLMKH